MTSLNIRPRIYLYVKTKKELVTFLTTIYIIEPKKCNFLLYFDKFLYIFRIVILFTSK